LSHYGLIPEKVFAIRSITTKRAKQLENAFGVLSILPCRRIIFSAVQNIDLDIIRQCVEVERKKGESGLLEKFLETINIARR
jgi:hypothetical protein